MKAIKVIVLLICVLVSGCSGGISVSMSTSGEFHPFAKSEDVAQIVGNVPIHTTSTGKSYNGR